MSKKVKKEEIVGIPGSRRQRSEKDASLLNGEPPNEDNTPKDSDVYTSVILSLISNSKGETFL